MNTATAAPAPDEDPPRTGICPGHWYIPTVEVRLADGSMLIKPQKPVRRGTSNQVSKWTGLSKKCLARLAESGFITCARGGPNTLFYYPGEIEAFLQETTKDPDFWNASRLAQYAIRRRSIQK